MGENARLKVKLKVKAVVLLLVSVDCRAYMC